MTNIDISSSFRSWKILALNVSGPWLLFVRIHKQPKMKLYEAKKQTQISNISCIPGWPGTCYVAENNLEFLIPLYLSWVLGLQHASIYWVLWNAGNQTSCILGKHSTRWTMSPSLFSISLFIMGLSC